MSSRPFDYETEAPFGASLLKRLMVSLACALLIAAFFVWALGRAVDHEILVCQQSVSASGDLYLNDCERYRP